MRCALTSLGLVVVVLGTAVPRAAANENERRLSIAGVVSSVSLDAFDTSDTTEAYGRTVAPPGVSATGSNSAGTSTRRSQATCPMPAEIQ